MIRWSSSRRVLLIQCGRSQEWTFFEVWDKLKVLVRLSEDFESLRSWQNYLFFQVEEGLVLLEARRDGDIHLDKKILDPRC